MTETRTMHPTPASTEKPLRAASTLILLRDSDTGPQVLMLKRHGLSEVLAVLNTNHF